MAQKKDTTIYYLKKSIKNIATSKDSAAYILAIYPPDTTANENLFVVEEFYKDGKKRMLGSSSVNNLDLKFEGPQIIYFPNGHKMRISNFSNGKLLGDMIEYYPNGEIYNLKHFTEKGKMQMIECRDSTGNVTTEKGNGSWVWFLDDSVKNDYMIGKVENETQTGTWIGFRKNQKIFECVYGYGERNFTKIYDDKVFEKMFHAQQKAEFPGGAVVFKKYIAINTRYPEAAKLKGTKGQVKLSFVVGTDGHLTDVKIIEGLGDGCDEEAIRVLQQSPRWMPAKDDGDLTTEFHRVLIAFPPTDPKSITK